MVEEEGEVKDDNEDSDEEEDESETKTVRANSRHQNGKVPRIFVDRGTEGVRADPRMNSDISGSPSSALRNCDLDLAGSRYSFFLTRPAGRHRRRRGRKGRRRCWTRSVTPWIASLISLMSAPFQGFLRILSRLRVPRFLGRPAHSKGRCPVRTRIVWVLRLYHVRSSL